MPLSWLSDWKCTAAQQDHCRMTRVAYQGDKLAKPLDKLELT